MMTHAVDKRLAHVKLLMLLVCGRARSLGAAVRLGDGKILLCLVSADAIHPKRRTRRQGTDFLVGGERFGNTAKKAVSNPTGGFWVSRDLSTCQQRFNL